MEYVVAVRADAGFPKDHVVLVPPQRDARKVAIGCICALGISGTAFDITPYHRPG